MSRPPRADADGSSSHRVLWIKLAAFQPLLAEPGTNYHYSNIGFEILGLIAARAGGRSIESLYRERIFEPLALPQHRL